ncbi:MAG: phosphate:Na+ symporter, partial [Gammaproteobacteria bacterium]
AVLFTASLAASGLIDRELTLLLVLGANLGAGFPVFSSTAGQDARQRRAPLGNIIFRSIGVVVALILLEQIVLYSALLSLDPVQYTIAMHIAFNVLLALAFLPMTSPFAAYLDKKYPKPVSTEDEQWNSSLLSNAIITDPDAALSAAARETIRLGAVVQGMFHDVIIALRENDRNLAKEIASRDDQVDYLHREIKLYVTDASRLELSETQSARATQILTFVTDIEHIGDIIESVAGYARRKSIKGLQFSDAGMEDLENMYQRVLKSMHTAFDVFMSGDKTLADQLIKEKRSVGRLERTLARAHLRRLRDGLSQSIETSSFHQDVLRDFKRIHSHLVAVAYTTIAIGQPLETEDDF